MINTSGGQSVVGGPSYLFVLWSASLTFFPSFPHALASPPKPVKTKTQQYLAGKESPPLFLPKGSFSSSPHSFFFFFHSSFFSRSSFDATPLPPSTFPRLRGGKPLSPSQGPHAKPGRGISEKVPRGLQYPTPTHPVDKTQLPPPALFPKKKIEKGKSHDSNVQGPRPRRRGGGGGSQGKVQQQDQEEGGEEDARCG